jgi:hypothetical protein
MASFLEALAQIDSIGLDGVLKAAESLPWPLLAVILAISAIYNMWKKFQIESD